MDVPILAYHKVSDQFELGINTVSIRSFKNQIKYLVENHYYTISLEQYLNKDFEAKSEQHPIIITFDDADQSVFLNAFPLLRSYGFTATLFVVSNYVGQLNSWDANLGGIYSRHLNWEEISKLADEGWEIGSHTATHRDLLGLSINEVTNELQISREIIEQEIERPIHFLSYPFNRFDRRIISQAQQIGYCGGCALFVKKKMNGCPEQFMMQRHGVYSIDTLYWFKKKLCNSQVEQFKQKIICRAALGTIWYKRYRK